MSFVYPIRCRGMLIPSTILYLADGGYSSRTCSEEEPARCHDIVVNVLHVDAVATVAQQCSLTVGAEVTWPVTCLHSQIMMCRRKQDGSIILLQVWYLVKRKDDDRNRKSQIMGRSTIF